MADWAQAGTPPQPILCQGLMQEVPELSNFLRQSTFSAIVLRPHLPSGSRDVVISQPLALSNGQTRRWDVDYPT